MGHWHQLAWLYLEKSRHQLRLTPWWDELALASRPALSWQWQARTLAKQHLKKSRPWLLEGAGTDISQVFSSEEYVHYKSWHFYQPFSVWEKSRHLYQPFNVWKGSRHWYQPFSTWGGSRHSYQPFLVLEGRRHLYRPFTIWKGSRHWYQQFSVWEGNRHCYQPFYFWDGNRHCYQLGSVFWRSVTRAGLVISQDQFLEWRTHW